MDQFPASTTGWLIGAIGIIILTTALSLLKFLTKTLLLHLRTCELIQCSNNATCEVSPKNWLWNAKLRLAEMSFGTERLTNALMEPSKTADGYWFSEVRD